MIVVPYLGRDTDVVQGLNASLIHKGARAQTWDDAVHSRAAPPLRFERLPFAHPLYVLFSSGTTGMPKCIVHSAGGALMKHICEHRLHADVREGDRVFYFTTLGWMMWNWLVSGLASGATLLLYDGSPFHPDGNILWDYAQQEKVTQFGTSAKYIDALQEGRAAPGKSHDLASLRTVLSTGSPLAPDSFDVRLPGREGRRAPGLHVGRHGPVRLLRAGRFRASPSTWARYRARRWGSLSRCSTTRAGRRRTARASSSARSRSRPCRSGFWDDPGDKKYHATYFARFPNVWHHGDFAEWTEHGGMVIHGRSDATLNPGGVRIGTAEIYRQVELLQEVQESIVIGQDWDNDVRVVLFVVLKPGHALDDPLRDRIKKQIRVGASPRHVPARIIQVADIPRSKSGKISELAVRDIVHGRDIKNREALANPEALDIYRNMAELAQ